MLAKNVESKPVAFMKYSIRKKLIKEGKTNYEASGAYRMFVLYLGGSKLIYYSEYNDKKRFELKIKDHDTNISSRYQVAFQDALVQKYFKLWHGKKVRGNREVFKGKVITEEESCDNI